MRLLKLVVRNFLSWESVSLDLDNQGIVFLCGDNGSGKTALFDAIDWCLYKKVSKKIPVDEVLRNGSGGDCSVRLEFLDAQGKRCHVTRYRQHHKFGDALILYRDGKSITASTIPATEERLKKLIVLSRAAFNNAFLFSQESEFYFSAFTDAQQKNVLRELLGLDVLVRSRKIAQARYVEWSLKKAAHHESLYLLAQQLTHVNALIKEESKKKRANVSALKKEEAAYIAWITEQERAANKLKKRLAAKADEDKSSPPCPACGKRALHCTVCTWEAPASPWHKDETTRSRYALLAQSYEATINKLGELRISLAELRGHYAAQRNDSTLTVLKRQKEELESQCTARKFDLARAESMVAHCLFWRTGFGPFGIELYALRHALPLLNEQIDKYLLPMFPGVRFTYSLAEGGALTSTLEHSGAHRLTGLSRGQKRRIEICVGLALQDLMRMFTGTSTNVVLLDEVFEGLDSEGIEAAVSLLRGLQRSSVFIISHQAQLAGYFDNVRYISLIDGVSRFVEGA